MDMRAVLLLLLVLVLYTLAKSHGSTNRGLIGTDGNF